MTLRWDGEQRQGRVSSTKHRRSWKEGLGKQRPAQSPHILTSRPGTCQTPRCSAHEGPSPGFWPHAQVLPAAFPIIQQ